MESSQVFFHLHLSGNSIFRWKSYTEQENTRTHKKEKKTEQNETKQTNKKTNKKMKNLHSKNAAKKEKKVKE